MNCRPSDPCVTLSEVCPLRTPVLNRKYFGSAGSTSRHTLYRSLDYFFNPASRLAYFLGQRPYAHSRGAVWAVSIFLSTQVDWGTLVNMCSRAGSAFGLLAIFRRIFQYFDETTSKFRCFLEPPQRAAERSISGQFVSYLGTRTFSVLLFCQGAHRVASIENTPGGGLA